MIEDEDYKTLRDSTDSQDAFDLLGLAARLEKHELLEFRRLAAHLYKKNSRWEESISLSKRDKLYKDAIDTAATSGSTPIAEDLLAYFVYVLPSFSIQESRPILISLVVEEIVISEFASVTRLLCSHVMI